VDRGEREHLALVPLRIIISPTPAAAVSSVYRLYIFYALPRYKARFINILLLLREFLLVVPQPTTQKFFPTESSSPHSLIGILTPPTGYTKPDSH
jgi:hypothetical protein